MVASGQIACLQCDLLLPTPALAEGERAGCPRCGHHLIASPKDGLSGGLAFALSAVVFLVLSCVFPFLSMKVGGSENSMTLAQSAIEIWRHGHQVVAALVLAFIVLVPGRMLAALLALLVPLARGRNAPWLVPAGRLAFFLGPWGMAEVFVIGVIVSLVKLMQMATIILGPSFWSYVAFSICLTAALSRLDRAYVWDAIEMKSSA